ncbi:hypothetical protein C8Q70DRAFT_639916 [Cubamyces menziesii]|nr:hypothetical protein C8Q70DRAFT_639916 [Cubamyces menziesii]
MPIFSLWPLCASPVRVQGICERGEGEERERMRGMSCWSFTYHPDSVHPSRSLPPQSQIPSPSPRMEGLLATARPPPLSLFVHSSRRKLRRPQPALSTRYLSRIHLHTVYCHLQLLSSSLPPFLRPHHLIPPWHTIRATTFHRPPRPIISSPSTSHLFLFPFLRSIHASSAFILLLTAYPLLGSLTSPSSIQIPPCRPFPSSGSRVIPILSSTTPSPLGRWPPLNLDSPPPSATQRPPSRGPLPHARSSDILLSAPTRSPCADLFPLDVSSRSLSPLLRHPNITNPTPPTPPCSSASTLRASDDVPNSREPDPAIRMLASRSMTIYFQGHLNRGRVLHPE